MAVARQGIIKQTDGYITLDEHIRMPQDDEYAPEPTLSQESVNDNDSPKTDSAATKTKRKTKE